MILSVIYCRDSSRAKSERERSYDTHIRYLNGIKDRIRFAGPLASADGARGQGDENLAGSFFVMAEPPAVAHGLMQADPYALSGVWQRVSVFRAINVFGKWVLPEPVRASGPLYIAMGGEGDAELVPRDIALFGTQLRAEVMGAESAPATSWGTAVIFAAASLQEAKSMVLPQVAGAERAVETWAVPISVGTWKGAAKPTSTGNLNE